MTRNEEPNVEPSEVREPPLAEMLAQIVEATDELVAMHVGDDELDRRLERIKANAGRLDGGGRSADRDAAEQIVPAAWREAEHVTAASSTNRAALAASAEQGDGFSGRTTAVSVDDGRDVAALVTEACDGSQRAWNAIVNRYAPLIWAIGRRHDLSRPDIDDVGQIVWLKLVEQLASIRDPAALPGWIATTTRNECLRVLRSNRLPGEAENWAGPEPYAEGGYTEIEQELERVQRQAALRSAFRELRPRCQELLSQLFKEQRPAYREISATLGMKIGSIGPSRERCLAELRRIPALAALLEGDGPTHDDLAVLFSQQSATKNSETER